VYFIAGRRETLATLTLLTGLDEGSGQDFSRLKEAYLGWLRARVAPEAIGPGGSEPDFVDDADTEARLLRGFVTADAHQDAREDANAITDESIAATMKQRNPVSVAGKLGRLRGAHHAMTQIEPGLASVFSAVANRVFVVEIDGEVGGSSPRHTGVIWANPPVAASTWDLVEYLLHELTHHLLYLDEHLHGHYARGRNTPEIFARSAIRRQRRPLRAAFHSLVVGLEILRLRRLTERPEVTTAVHPATDVMMDACRQTIASIVEAAHWQRSFRSRGLFLFEACRQTWEELAMTDPESAVALFDAC
jgi:hypothetical protein